MCPACAKSIEQALAEGQGLIVRREVPRLASSLDRARAAGEVIQVVRGVYCAATATLDWRLRLRAVLAIEPAAVVIERAAAALTWWPDIAVSDLIVASRVRKHTSTCGVTWVQRRVDPDHVVEVEGVRITNPALTVLDLVPSLGGQAIDEGLRRGAVTLAELETMFDATGSRPGNRERRHLLDDSRDEPWSEAERHLHRLLRQLDLPCRFVTNHRVSLPSGRHCYLDVALVDLLLGLEVDGYEFHGPRDAFERDRARDADAASLGWQVVRWSAAAVLTDPETVSRQISDIIARRLALFRGGRLGG